MSRLLQLSKLKARQWALLLRALVTVSVVRVGLSTIGYRRVSALTPRMKLSTDEGRLGEYGTGGNVRELVWAVSNAARIVPLASCLTQALAGQIMLSQAGHDCEVRIGVARGAGKAFGAHAWLVTDDVIVLGDRANLTSTYRQIAVLRPRQGSLKPQNADQKNAPR